MHHLSRTKIKNYRSCANVELSLGNCTPIVGYNNAGKSNIMSAIEWLISPKALTTGDFYDATLAVSMEGAIEGLARISHSHPASFADWAVYRHDHSGAAIIR